MKSNILKVITEFKKEVPELDNLLTTKDPTTYKSLLAVTKKLNDVVTKIERLVTTESKSNFENRIISVFKPVFDSVPELEWLPLYVWGRLCVYENAGDFFEESFYGYEGYGLGHLLDMQYDNKMSNKVMQQVEEVLFKDKKKDKAYDGSTYYYYKDLKEEYNTRFNSDLLIGYYGGDSGGGTMLYLTKDTQGNLYVKTTGCGTPE